MPAYMIARATINNRAKFEQEFLPAIKPAFAPHGCKLLAQSDNVVTLIGDDKIAHLAIAEFPSLAAAQACATSREFKAAMAIAGTIMTDHYIRMVDGLATPVEAAAGNSQKELA
jgi:uncharacterized protein (DUF1330 family)